MLPSWLIFSDLLAGNDVLSRQENQPIHKNIFNYIFHLTFLKKSDGEIELYLKHSAFRARALIHFSVFEFESEFHHSNTWKHQWHSNCPFLALTLDVLDWTNCSFWSFNAPSAIFWKRWISDLKCNFKMGLFSSNFEHFFKCFNLAVSIVIPNRFKTHVVISKRIRFRCIFACFFTCFEFYFKVIKKFCIFIQICIKSANVGSNCIKNAAR